MQLILKTITGQNSTVECPEDATVLQLKEIVQSQQGHNPAYTKLICTGRILDDAVALSEYGVKDGSTLVMMVEQPPPPPAPIDEMAEAQAAPVDEEYEQTVQQIVDMGFPIDQVELALEAAHNIPEHAIEYLMNGIPTDALGQDDEAEEPYENPLAYLEDNPSFQQIRTLIQNDPNMLTSLLNQLETQNPELFAIIQEHPDDLMSMINRGMQQSNQPAIDPTLIVGLDDIPQQEVPNVVLEEELSEQETTAVHNLVALGFDYEDAVEAYLLCNKNEELAANFLFENYTPSSGQNP